MNNTRDAIPPFAAATGSALKACPFCGCDGLWMVKDDIKDEGWVQCSVCKARGPLGRPHQLATHYWNRRRETWTLPADGSKPVVCCSKCGERINRERKFPIEGSLVLCGLCEDDALNTEVSDAGPVASNCNESESRRSLD